MPVMLQALDENAMQHITYPYSIHFFFPFPFVFGETPLEATLLAREV